MTEYSEEMRNLMNGIYSKLKHSENYHKSKELEEEFGVPGSTIREAVHNMRVSMFPIISDGNGYKFARSESEMKQCIRSMYSRVRSIAEAARGLVGARDRFYSGQTSMEFEMIDQVTEKIKVLNEDNIFRH